MDNNSCLEHENHLKYLVRKLTHSGKEELDPEKFKKVKNICKSSDIYVVKLFQFLLLDLKKRHAEVRFSCFSICHEIFLRSHCFRMLFLGKYKEILDFIFPVDKKDKLKPVDVAQRLEHKAIISFNTWITKYVDKYQCLRDFESYLRFCKHVDFTELKVIPPDLRAKLAAEKAEHAKQKEEVSIKINYELSKLKPELMADLTAFKNCLGLLIPNVNNFFVPLSLSSVNSEVDLTKGFYKSSPNINFEMKSNNISDANSIENSKTSQSPAQEKKSINESEEESVVIDLSDIHNIYETDDNLPLIENLREYAGIFNKQYIPKLKEFIKQLQSFCDDNDELVQELKTIKRSLDQATDAYMSLKIISLRKKSQNPEDSDYDDDFEEVSDEEEEARAEAEILLGMMEKESAIVTSEKKVYHSSLSNDVNASSSTSRDNQTNITNSAKGLSPESFTQEWKPPMFFVNPLAGLSQVWLSASYSEEDFESCKRDVAGVSTQAVNISTPFEAVMWQCRSPMPSGRLCPRRDRLKCPLHGRVLPRKKATGQPDVDYAKRVLEKAEHDASSSELKDASDAPSCSKNITDSTGPSKGEPLSVSAAQNLLTDVMKAEEKEARVRMNLDLDWQNPRLLRRLEEKTGIDLNMSKLKKRSRGDCSGLTDLKALEDTPRKRLAKKVLSKRAVQRLNKALARQ